MKFRAATVIIASAGILLAATACSSGTSTGSPSGGASAKSASPAAAKTYTADDLPKILTTAEKKVGVTGTVLDDSQVQAKLKQAKGTGGIAALLNSSGVTISPAACGSTIKTALNQTPPSGSVNSILTYGNNAVTVTAISGKTLPADLTSGSEKRVDDLVKGCSSMKISVTQSGQTVSIPLTIKKSDVSTDADKTVAIQETLTVPSATGGAGTPLTVDVVSAVAGNLFISAQASSGAVTASANLSASSSPSIEDVINAVVAAAK